MTDTQPTTCERTELETTLRLCFRLAHNAASYDVAQQWLNAASIAAERLAALAVFEAAAAANAHTTATDIADLVTGPLLAAVRTMQDPWRTDTADVEAKATLASVDPRLVEVANTLADLQHSLAH